ncbi:sugar phosphate isomerase/epimerase [Paenibacillus sp. N3.4]|uniref:sugar phosphate isomerase/epimerase family protein n=1 Tax=Paenibacillus sp. N3.4 TaxID=2603222 RepID=UPI0011CBA993|nr:TIM barrel protein [Paenibacillus sp. N3.4]TXK84179.1 TIM barrel protein [Paenibacillus sp. N3.4]
MSYLSLSTWSLHRNLGPLHWHHWDSEARTIISTEAAQPQTIHLLDLPHRLAEEGFSALEIGHFHFPSTEPDYLKELKHAFLQSGIVFDTLLLDYGDISSADEDRRAADIRFIQHWIDVAARSGAKRIRVIAGDSEPTDEMALARSIEALRELHAYGCERDVQVITENFKKLTSTADNCLAIMKALDGNMQLIADFGNFHGAGKYDELSAILPYAVSAHAKAHYDDQGFPDVSEYKQCLDRLTEANYQGAISLIYDGAGDMWEGINRIRNIVQPYLD